MDTILINGKVYTMDKKRSIKEAIGIKNGRIEKLGTNEEILSLKDSGTEIIDLKGNLILPGFNDSYTHLVNLGYTLTMVGLQGVNSIDEIGKRILDYIEDHNLKKASWIRGTGWNQDYFQDEKRFPTRFDLDKISTEYPIIITRTCGHVAVANSLALKLLNITKDTPQIEGGHFDLDESGEPLGIFRENAISLIYNSLPNPTREETKAMMKMAIKEFHKLGITSVGTDDFEALPNKDYKQILESYLDLRENNELNIRVNQQCLLPSIDKLSSFLEEGYNTGWGDENYRIGPLKLLLDGSLGARTAALTKAYKDDNTTMGIVTMEVEELWKIVEYAHKNNTQVAIHAIGDRAMYMSMESIERALKKYPKKDHRHGIVHCQITDEVLLNKFKELDLVAYIQPIFLDYDWKIVRDRVGVDLEKTSYNWKSLVDKGVNIACGSDAPVETFNVLYGIYEAVTRKDLQGNPKEGWLPEQGLTVDEAVYGYTLGGAYSTFEEKIKGSIEEGKLADLVVLSKDIFEIPAEEIKDVEVLTTIFSGRIVYER
ncbi:MAG: amidohydrolase [Tissierellia bacterium]|nr:amidohydrolase [Tissierellia bacterium]